MVLDPDTRCFSLRRVNPFLGVVAVVKTPAARALSVDGVHWQIQILAHPPRGLWARGGDQEGLRYFRFGIWSEPEGMTRVPLNPILDAGRMLAESERLISQVQSATPALPFPLGPELELWLLDGEGLPLALLGTALPQTDLDEVAAADWSAGGRGGERPFVSPTLVAQGLLERDASGRHYHAEALERLVAQRAGSRRLAQWFWIQGEDALGLDHRADPSLRGRRLARSNLPPCLSAPTGRRRPRGVWSTSTSPGSHPTCSPCPVCRTRCGGTWRPRRCSMRCGWTPCGDSILGSWIRS